MEVFEATLLVTILVGVAFSCNIGFSMNEWAPSNLPIRDMTSDPVLN